MFSNVQEPYPIISADFHTLLFPFEIPCIFDLCHHRDTPLILSSLQWLKLIRSLSSLCWNTHRICGPSAASLLFQACLSSRVLFSVFFPAVGMELFYIYRMWKIKQACKKYSSVVHSTKTFLCLFTLDVWFYEETNWLQKYRTDDQKCG